MERPNCQEKLPWRFNTPVSHHDFSAYSWWHLSLTGFPDVLAIACLLLWLPCSVMKVSHEYYFPLATVRNNLLSFPHGWFLMDPITNTYSWRYFCHSWRFLAIRKFHVWGSVSSMVGWNWWLWDGGREREIERPTCTSSNNELLSNFPHIQKSRKKSFTLSTRVQRTIYVDV
jgi:hypothetical protein